MKNVKTIETDNFCYENKRLVLLSGCSFYDLQDDISNLSEEELAMMKDIREIAFSEGIGAVDEELWRALDQEDCECLEHVEWLDFKEASDLEGDLYISGLPALTKLVLPENMEDLSELTIEDCPKLNEIHIIRLGKVGDFSSYADQRYDLYASSVTEDFYESFADKEVRNNFGRDVKKLFIPQKDMERVQALLDNYPLAQGRRIELKPLPAHYTVPTSNVASKGKTRRAAEKQAKAQAEEEEYWKLRTEVEQRINSENGHDQQLEVKGIAFKMIYVKGGTYEMRRDKCPGSCTITVSSFMMCETQVTQELWHAVMGYNPSKNKKCLFFDNKQHPVEQMSPKECKTFLDKLGSLTGRKFRLPTCAEWQYAAIGGVKSKGYRYAGSDNVDEVAWHRDNSGMTTHAVKQKKPNELGLYDMSGNVSEMCEGGMPWDDMPKKGVDLTPWEAGRIVNARQVGQDLCGGSYYDGPHWRGGDCTCSCHNSNCYKGRKDESIGFRMICDID